MVALLNAGLSVALEQLRELRSQLLLSGASTLPLQDAEPQLLSVVPSVTVTSLNLALRAVPLSSPLLTRNVTDTTPVLELMGLETPYSRKLVPLTSMDQPLMSWL